MKLTGILVWSFYCEPSLIKHRFGGLHHRQLCNRAPTPAALGEPHHGTHSWVPRLKSHTNWDQFGLISVTAGWVSSLSNKHSSINASSLELTPKTLKTVRGRILVWKPTWDFKNTFKATGKRRQPRLCLSWLFICFVSNTLVSDDHVST